MTIASRTKESTSGRLRRGVIRLKKAAIKYNLAFIRMRRARNGGMNHKRLRNRSVCMFAGRHIYIYIGTAALFTAAALIMPLNARRRSAIKVRAARPSEDAISGRAKKPFANGSAKCGSTVL